MADLISVKIEQGGGILQGNLSQFYDHFRARQLIKEAMDDIADAVEIEATRQAPEHTGALKAHPVSRDDTRLGITTDVPAFGNQQSVRGARGRFVAAVPIGTPVGETIIRTTLGIPEEPMHAIWVHDGTGIYGPKKQMITAHRPGGFMVFPKSRWPTAVFKRSIYRFQAVKGQKPQPYLDRAFLVVDKSYVPVRIELLRAEIAAET